eukprot:augustus_masked-scaffold_7-processed-gene-5.10-mRNA-1 protein AED:0.32 eAED:0.32 QI:0/-1/0/1/-1/1/1/0/1963
MRDNQRVLWKILAHYQGPDHEELRNFMFPLGTELLQSLDVSDLGEKGKVLRDFTLFMTLLPLSLKYSVWLRVVSSIVNDLLSSRVDEKYALEVLGFLEGPAQVWRSFLKPKESEVKERVEHFIETNWNDIDHISLFTMAFILVKLPQNNFKLESTFISQPLVKKMFEKLTVANSIQHLPNSFAPYFVSLYAYLGFNVLKTLPEEATLRENLHSSFYVVKKGVLSQSRSKEENGLLKAHILKNGTMEETLPQVDMLLKIKRPKQMNTFAAQHETQKKMISEVSPNMNGYNLSEEEYENLSNKVTSADIINAEYSTTVLMVFHQYLVHLVSRSKSLVQINELLESLLELGVSSEKPLTQHIDDLLKRLLDILIQVLNSNSSFVLIDLEDTAILCQRLVFLKKATVGSYLDRFVNFSVALMKHKQTERVFDSITFLMTQLGSTEGLVLVHNFLRRSLTLLKEATSPAVDELLFSRHFSILVDYLVSKRNLFSRQLIKDIESIFNHLLKVECATSGSPLAESFLNFFISLPNLYCDKMLPCVELINSPVTNSQACELDNSSVSRCKGHLLELYIRLTRRMVAKRGFATFSRMETFHGIAGVEVYSYVFFNQQSLNLLPFCHPNRLPDTRPVKALLKRATAMSRDSANVNFKPKQMEVHKLLELWRSTSSSQSADSWFARICFEMTKQCPSRPIRVIANLPQQYFARRLFKPTFLSFWVQLSQESRLMLSNSLDAVLIKKEMSSDVRSKIVDLFAYMSRKGYYLGTSSILIDKAAIEAQCFAFALYHKELESRMLPSFTLPGLNYVQRKLDFTSKAENGSPDSDLALSKFNLRTHPIATLTNCSEYIFYLTKRASWRRVIQIFSKLKKSFDAMSPMATYKVPILQTPSALNLLDANKDHRVFEEYFSLGEKLFKPESMPILQDIASEVSKSCLALGEWDLLKDSLGFLKKPSWEFHYYQSLSLLGEGKYYKAMDEANLGKAQLLEDKGNKFSKKHSTPWLLRAQLLQEVNEMANVLVTLEVDSSKELELLQKVRTLWSDRFEAIPKSSEYLLPLYLNRSLLFSPENDTKHWLEFYSSCELNGNIALGRKLLLSLGINKFRALDSPLHSYVSPLFETNFSSFKSEEDRINIEGVVKFPPLKHVVANKSLCPAVAEAFCKQLWSEGLHSKAYSRLTQLQTALCFLLQQQTSSFRLNTRGENSVLAQHLTASSGSIEKVFVSTSCLLGDWATSSTPLELQNLLQVKSFDACSVYADALEVNSHSITAWKGWALQNLSLFTRNSDSSEQSTGLLLNAVQGFYRVIGLSHAKNATIITDLLKLLELWFDHGDIPEVSEAVEEGFSTINLSVWFNVIPQLMARINDIGDLTSKLLLLLSNISSHPLLFPLIVTGTSDKMHKKQSAQFLLAHIQKKDPILVKQALAVSRELTRIASLWEENWVTALEHAARQYFGSNGRFENMLSALLPLHAELAQGPMTPHETLFFQKHARPLQLAAELLQEYISRSQRTSVQSRSMLQTGAWTATPRDFVEEVHEIFLEQAWKYYHETFKNLSEDLTKTVLDLRTISPVLSQLRDLQLLLPGVAFREERFRQRPRLTKFLTKVEVIGSKQRPKKIFVLATDGKEYPFLLKGHEDLRLDERMMQLFGTINKLHAKFRLDQRIKTYDVVPLNKTIGIVEFVSGYKPFHDLVQKYRSGVDVPLNSEHQLISLETKSYEKLPLSRKYEVFTKVKGLLTGDDLKNSFFARAADSDDWLTRRKQFTSSLANMSVVGYLIGLGDRHPSNILICSETNQILHIDFGDCFEVAMRREKFPETVPFRLTRMFVNAMEINAVERSYLSSATSTLGVLRKNKSTLLTLLEAFIHDPIVGWDATEKVITWKLDEKDNFPEGSSNSQLPFELPNLGLSVGSRVRVRHFVTSEQALECLRRVEVKLTGFDSLNGTEKATIQQQVRELIAEATDDFNLCQIYFGWCPFW